MENTTTPETEVTEIVSASVSEPELADEPEELSEIDEDDDAAEPTGSGLVSGAFGLTAAVFGLVSLTGSWLGNVYQTRIELQHEIKGATTAKLTLDMYASMWRTEALWGGIFALAALLFGAGVLAAPSLLLSGKTPGWARGAALGGIVLGAVGLLLALLTWFGVFAGELTSTG